MTVIDRATATAFAIAVNRIRPTWDATGITAMIVNGTPRQATLSQVLIAATLMAENGSVQKPSADLFRDGPWWDRSTVDNKRPEWAANRARCIDHPTQAAHACPDCARQRAEPVDLDALPEVKAVKVQLARIDHRRNARPVELTSDVSAARSAIDQEATS